MRTAPRLLISLKRIIVVLAILLLSLQQPVHTYGQGQVEGHLEVSPPLMPIKLAKALCGTTRQADRIAQAIESREINVDILSAAGFYKRYRLLDGQRSATAFAYGNTIYLRANSSTLLTDLVHEGTHALDHLSGRDWTRRQLEMRAYYYEHKFQKAVGCQVQFRNLVDLAVFVYGMY